MYEIDDLDGAMLHPRWLMLPVMLLNPLEISRTEFAWPNWQNNMLIKCVQLSMPLLNLSLSYFFTILLKISLGKMPIICAKSDNFTMGLRIFCGAKQNYRFWRKPAPFFILSKNYFGRMWFLVLNWIEVASGLSCKQLSIKDFWKLGKYNVEEQY